MTAPTLRSPLADLLRAHTPAAAAVREGISVAEWPHVACLVLRGHADNAAFMAAVQSAAGVALPMQPSTHARAGAVMALWVSPDEWWLLVPRAARDALLTALRGAVAVLHAQVVDNSGGIALLRVAGPEHVTLLRHLTPYDTDKITPGRCVSTTIPKATMTVIRADNDGVMLLFRRSFADWIWRLIERSARPYGLAVCTPAQLSAPAFDAMLADVDATCGSQA